MSEDARRAREHRARGRATHDKRVFESASFAPYGLDARWSGLRWIGGHAESDGRVTLLELAHGDSPWDQTSPQVRVETFGGSSASDPRYLFDVARDLVQHFWHETGVLPDDVRRAVFATDRSGQDPTGPWAAADVTVDERMVPFRVLAHDDYWVGVGSFDDSVVAVRARGWSLDQTGVVTICDLGPYLDGSVEIVTRWRPR